MKPEQGGGAEKPPRVGRSLLARAALGGFLIVVLAAGATATATLLQVDDVAGRIPTLPGPTSADVTPAQAGKAQTILLLGSDHRYSDRGDPARSDTMMLIRLDPNRPVIPVLNLPRDLRVEIPGHGTDKLNQAYSIGGPALTLKTIKELTGLEVNHVVNVRFRGFRKAVDAVGCVYVDIDRRYEHSNAGLPIGLRYAEIDIQPGYQRLCGADALDYVRYRHNDSDIVRAARQQDFLRAAKDQLTTSSLIDKRTDLLRIFADAAQTDRALSTTTGLLRLLKLALFSSGHPVRQVPFPAQFEVDTLPGGAEIAYVVASPEAVRRTAERFLHATKANAGRPRVQLTPRKRGRHRSPTAVIAARAAGEALLGRTHGVRRLGFPVRFPARLTSSAHYAEDGLRLYTLRDRAGRPHRAYRLVVVGNAIEGQYYGVQGTDWRTAPILAGAHSPRTVHGRRLDLYRDGPRLRLVAWRTPSAVYWVSNTLSLSLTNSQMLEIAGSLSRARSPKR